MCSKSQNDKEEDVYACQRIYGIIFLTVNFHFMTSKGYLFLNSDQVKSILLEGQKEAAKKELGKGIRADELFGRRGHQRKLEKGHLPYDGRIT